MKCYKVLINGQNFLLKLEDVYAKYGFFTPRFVHAVDALIAGSSAVEDFLHTPKYKELMSTALNSEGDPPRVVAAQIEESPSQTLTEQAFGLSYYPMEPEEGGPQRPLSKSPQSSSVKII